jgi:hypothetical protein
MVSVGKTGKNASGTATATTTTTARMARVNTATIPIVQYLGQYAPA